MKLEEAKKILTDNEYQIVEGRRPERYGGSAQNFLDDLEEEERIKFLKEYLIYRLRKDNEWTEEHDLDYYLNFENYDSLNKIYTTVFVDTMF